MITFKEYQSEAWKTAIYRDKGNNINYPTHGLCGEAGEVANQVKKIDRDDNGILTDQRKKKIMSELSDVLWYVNAICQECSFSMEEVARYNIDKLSDRHERGQIVGDGDSR